MIQIIQLKGKDKHLYRLVAPMVMDPAVIRANNNYPFKTGEEYVWFIAINDREVVGFMPVETKKGKKAIINNYYVKPKKAGREEVLTPLLLAVVEEFPRESWLVSSVTLIQDKEMFEKFEFTSVDKKWIRYVKMFR